MSLPTEPADNPKPVVKDKNPHNYRKVGYSMIIISVSLVIIALLSWGLANDYHFSSNIMALQEVDAMTPKSGYNIEMFDISQPVGAKLKLLDHSDSLEQALSMQEQDAQQNQGKTIQVLLFNGTSSYNLKLMQDAEVYIQTPSTGYNVILDSYPLAVGAQLTLASHEESFDNATAYQKVQEDQIQGQEVKVLIFTPTYKDNLKMITNSSQAVGAYAVFENQTVAANATQATTNQTTVAAGANSTNATGAQSPQVVTTNQTTTASGNQSMPASANMTTGTTKTNMTMINNQTAITKPNMNGTTQTTANSTNMAGASQTAMPNVNMTGTAHVEKSNANLTVNNQSNETTGIGSSQPANSNPTVTIANGASSTKGSCTTTNCFNPQFITIQIGNTVTWTNADTVGHTATSGKLTDNKTGTIFDSGLINAGKSYTSTPFKTAGTYYYFCQVHPWMTGQITVVSSSDHTSQNATTSKSITLNETTGVSATGK